jgi:hypothetical protein
MFLGGRAILTPEVLENSFQVTGNPALAIGTGVLALALSSSALMAIWIRGPYLVGPAIGWAIYWLGAAYFHIVLQAALGREVDTAFLVRTMANHTAHGACIAER